MFPDEYAVQPAATASSTTNLQKVGDCNLYETNYMSGYYDANNRVYKDNLPTCNYNYLHHYLGNAVEFTAPAQLSATDTTEATNAVISR
jgi:hypothetical protein